MIGLYPSYHDEVLITVKARKDLAHDKQDYPKLQAYKDAQAVIEAHPSANSLGMLYLLRSFASVTNPREIAQNEHWTEQELLRYDATLAEVMEFYEQVLVHAEHQQPIRFAF